MTDDDLTARLRRREALWEWLANRPGTCPCDGDDPHCPNCTIQGEP